MDQNEQRHCYLRLITSLQQANEQRNLVSNKNERCCVSRNIFNTDTIHNYMQLKLRNFVTTTIRGLINEIKMCRIQNNVSRGSGEMVSGATGGEFECNAALADV